MKRKQWRWSPSHNNFSAYADGFIDGYVHAGKGQVRLLIDVDYNDDKYFRHNLLPIITHNLEERYNMRDKVDIYLL